MFYLRHTHLSAQFRSIRAIALLFFLWFAQSSLAQFDDAKFIYLSEEPTVPDAFIYEIYEDHLGFFWFCTSEGLYKYDGYSYTHFMHNVLDETTISHPIVYTVYEDSANHLWIGTGAGLDLLHRTDWSVTRFTPHPALVEQGLKERNKVFSIHQTGDGNIWAGTASGIAMLDPGKMQFTHSTILGAISTRTTMYKNRLLSYNDSTLLSATNMGPLLLPDT